MINNFFAISDFNLSLADIYDLIYTLIPTGVSVAGYVLRSLGLYIIAKRRRIRNPWLSWIPLGNLWILGSISDQYQYVVKGKVKNKRKALLTLNILTYVAAFAGIIAAAVVIGMGLSELPQINDAQTIMTTMLANVMTVAFAWIAMVALSVAFAVIHYMALYDLYRSCDPANGMLYLLLSIFINITMPVFVFICRNKDLGMPPRKQDPTTFIQPEPVETPPWRPVDNTADPWENNPEQ